jgi:hypothetical protein
MLSRPRLRPLVVAFVAIVVGLAAALGALAILASIAPDASDPVRFAFGYATWVIVAASVIAGLAWLMRRSKPDV